MKKLILPALFCFIALVIWSCKKDPDWADLITVDKTTVTKDTLSGWSMKGNATNYSGCIDTSFYSRLDTVLVLNLRLSDSTGNVVRLTLTDPNGRFTPGSYTTSNKRVNVLVITNTGNYTTTDLTTGFSIEITNITSSLIEGVFAARLVNPSNNAVMNISNGKIRARIGRPNQCRDYPTDSTAIYTLITNGTACGNAVVQGTYIAGTPLSSGNTVVLQVRVASRGTYKVSTGSVNGMTFSGEGVFNANGVNNIILQGKGTPLVNGRDSITFTAGGSTCKFGVTVNSPSGIPNGVFTASNSLCDSARIQGTYTVGNPLDINNRVLINLNVTTPGSYDIFTQEAGGISFSGSGIFSTTGQQTVTLNGSGTPFQSGTLNVPITIRNQSCSLKVRVDTSNVSIPIPLNSWVFAEGSNVYAGPIVTATYGPSPAGTDWLQLLGNTLSGTDTTFELYVQMPPTATTPQPGVYNTDPSTASSNISDFKLIDGDPFTGTDIYFARTGNGFTTPVSITIRIVSYDDARKTVAGTFSGTAWDKNGNVVNISNGMFKAQIR